MNSPFSNSTSQGKVDKMMTTEQFEQIVASILAGKYSWACVLILRIAGYNPLHYIPYRTYNRLLKENCQCGQRNRKLPPAERISNPIDIEDLSHIASLEAEYSKIRGGNNIRWYYRF